MSMKMIESDRGRLFSSQREEAVSAADRQKGEKAQRGDLEFFMPLNSRYWSDGWS